LKILRAKKRQTPEKFILSFISSSGKLGKSIDLILKSSDNDIFSFQPVGDNTLSFGNTEQIDYSQNNLFVLYYSPFLTINDYDAGFGTSKAFKDSLYAVEPQNYNYGSAYPMGGTDDFTIKSNISVSKTFYKLVSFKQKEGITAYTDLNDEVWKQVKIE
jgi:hypothetical protein